MALTTNSVQYASSKNSSAPVLNNNWGRMTDMLDAVLVNGYSTQNVSSMSQTGGNITATFGVAHLYRAGQILLIAGANESVFNGRFRIDSVTSTTVVLKTDSLTTVTASGTITAKVAPLGYTIAFTKTNKRVYKSINPDNIMYYIFDNAFWSDGYTTSYTKMANVGLATEMTDVDTITGLQCPFNAASPNQNWTTTGSGNNAIRGWARIPHNCFSYQDDSTYLTATNSGDCAWSVVGNDEGFYICHSNGGLSDNTHETMLVYYVGKYASLTSNPFSYLLCINLSQATASTSQTISSSIITANGASTNLIFAKNDGTGIGSTTFKPLITSAIAANPSRSDTASASIEGATEVAAFPVYFPMSDTGVGIEGIMPFIRIPIGRFTASSANNMVAFKSSDTHVLQINAYAGGVVPATVSTLYFDLND